MANERPQGMELVANDPVKPVDLSAPETGTRPRTLPSIIEAVVTTLEQKVN